VIPLIGVTASYDECKKAYTLNENCVKAIRDVGGIPVVVPLIDDELYLRILAKRLDAMVFSGGVDVDPLMFKEQPHRKLGRICPLRDVVEVFLVKEMVKLQKPILGICRGMQVMNVALGGSLIQDIPSHFPKSIKHQQDAPREHATHEIEIIDSYSLLSDIFCKPTVMVNSYHHQSVKDIADKFKATAKAPDGVIEAIEIKEKGVFCMGVQWHPEEMYHNSPKQRRIFEYLVDAAKQKS